MGGKRRGLHVPPGSATERIPSFFPFLFSSFPPFFFSFFHSKACSKMLMPVRMVLCGKVSNIIFLYHHGMTIIWL